ncbi:MucR family transcriptional regulator [Thermopolyspora sp. NPDC052614]|uniref:MucR family transcriptional regulator n=1 Tax=Thermopolyspora sp. NPDC052614 TaxID=3155682 RepID=UPI00341272A9
MSMQQQPKVNAKLHAPVGQLVRDEVADRVLCHICGRWFRALGSHVRVHGLTADDYRAAFGLFATKALSSYEYSSARSATQRRVYQSSPHTRDNLAPGRRLAGTGVLNTLARRTSPQRRAAQLDELRAGRATRTRAARENLREALRELGYSDVGEGLATLYGERQSSMEALARRLGVGRATLRRALTEHGVPLRGSGVNTDAGRRSRVATNIARTADRVGTPDLRQWLRERRAEGWSLRRLARHLDRSVPWIRARLADGES